MADQSSHGTAPRAQRVGWPVNIAPQNARHVRQRDEGSDAVVKQRDQDAVKHGEVINDLPGFVLAYHVVGRVIEDMINTNFLQPHTGHLCGLLGEPMRVTHRRIASLGGVQRAGKIDCGTF